MSPFSLIDASNAAEAVALLRTHGPHAKVIAAGGDLLGLLKDGVQGVTLPLPRVVVNLSTAQELHRIERCNDGWSLGGILKRQKVLDSAMKQSATNINT